MSITASSVTPSNSAGSSLAPGSRITSIDAIRGLVMFTMIFVNDLAGVPSMIVPAWMRHFHGKSGMTFVDLVFPAFLFIVGMSIPFGLVSRLNKDKTVSRTILHVVTRTLSLLFIGIMMVNGSPDSAKMGWSGTLWSALMFLSAILAFCSISPPRKAESATDQKQTFRIISLIVRVFGFAFLLFLAVAFRGKDGHRIITFSPFSIHTEWYGILGLIGWAYLAGCALFLLFRCNRTSLLGCTVLLMCLYPADRNGAFEHFWLAHYVGIGGVLGSQAAITVAGVLLASILLDPDMASVRARSRFICRFIAGFAIAALLLHRLYGINKNAATPSWCLWACAITATLWFLFYLLADVDAEGNLARFAKPFAIAGQNVLLAYLLSEMLPSILGLFHLHDWYSELAQPGLACALARSAGCALVILGFTAAFNRIGFRLKL